MKHYIVTRFNLKWHGKLYKDRSWIEKRASLMKETLIKSLSVQENKNFELLVAIDENTENDIEDIIRGACGFKVSFVRLSSTQDLRKERFLSMFSEGDIISRVDSDDIVSKKYVENIQKFFKDESKRLFAFDYRHIGYFHMSSGRSVTHRYKAPSMFFSIRFFNNRTPYFMPHDQIKTAGVKVFNSDKVDCCCVVHGNNLKNSMDKKVDSGEKIDFGGWIR